MGAKKNELEQGLEDWVIGQRGFSHVLFWYYYQRDLF
jgi:hypothetical protein